MTDAAPGTTVLVVDDDTALRQVTRLLLERAGYTVVEATNGRQAVSVLDAAERIDVVLLDVMMPEMTGHEALPRLRELQPDLPVIFISGYAESEVADHLVAPTAFTSFLPKPTDVEVLAEEIERAIRA